MKIRHTDLPGVIVTESVPVTDQRGSFSRLYCKDELANVIATRHIVQINHSLTKLAGTVRGMHYQLPPYCEMKLVRCIRGRVWDVAVDLRAGSPTFLQWHAEELSPENNRMLVIPEGYAHGFQALEEDSELLYLHTGFYKPKAEGGVSCIDPRLSITWPLPVIGLSKRDSDYALIEVDFSGIAT